jgi:hypothetical protein
MECLVEEENVWKKNWPTLAYPMIEQEMKRVTCESMEALPCHDPPLKSSRLRRIAFWRLSEYGRTHSGCITLAGYTPEDERTIDRQERVHSLLPL